MTERYSPQTGDAKRRCLVNAGAVIVDGIFVAIGLIGVVLLVAAMFRTRRGQSARPAPTDGWRSRAAGLCADGREVIDLTAVNRGDEAESGLTLDLLSDVESRLDLLIAQIHDVQAAAPTPEDARRIQLAELHATSLNETVRTMRRGRLKSAASSPARFETLALQLATHRSALDDVLAEIARKTGRQQ